jgi:hypothetical protein
MAVPKPYPSLSTLTARFPSMSREDISDIAHALLQLLQLFLQICILLGHLLVLLLPLVATLLESLHFSLVVTGFDVGLAEPSAVSIFTIA